ncbi:hypothetical protein H4R35_002992 [Dimargaris xerosporica]|nr:hypothetical protein H4R35_002992 [Dimargaris xerosporica]
MRYEVTLLLLAAVAMAMGQPTMSGNSGIVDNPSSPSDLQPTPSGQPNRFKSWMNKFLISAKQALDPTKPKKASKDPWELPSDLKQWKESFETSHFDHFVKLVDEQGLLRKAIEKQYLEDPTGPYADEQQYQKHLETNNAEAKNWFNHYLWRHVKFHHDHDLLLESTRLDSSRVYITGDVVVASLCYHIHIFSDLYYKYAASEKSRSSETKQIPYDGVPYPDIFTGLPVLPDYDYDRSKSILRHYKAKGYKELSISDVIEGPLGAFNQDYVMEVPGLVERYLEVINNADFYQLKSTSYPLSRDALLYEIGHFNNKRVQYALNNIMAFQVIPELITAYVAKGYYDQVVMFIEKMGVSLYMDTFWKSIPDYRLDYYECAAYVALAQTMNDNATKFVRRLKNEYNLSIPRLYQCEVEVIDVKTVQENLREIFPKEFLLAPVDKSKCKWISEQLNRNLRFELNSL